MKILFAGTPAFAMQPLMSLAKTGQVVGVITQPDKKVGRKGILTPPPVKIAAEGLGLPLFQPQDPNGEIGEIKKFGADMMITCAYGKILSEELLSLFPLGVYNIHASLLPRYRGAAPIQRAMMDGEEETGVTVMKTVLAVDEGDILLQRKVKIEPFDTSLSLSARLSAVAAEAITEAVQLLEGGNFTLQKQGEGFTCKKVERTKVDFSLPAKRVSALIRALSPSPLAFSRLAGEEINFYMAEEEAWEEGARPGEIVCANPKEGLKVKCGKNAVCISFLQAAGGRVLLARDFLNGRKDLKGKVFE